MAHFSRTTALMRSRTSTGAFGGKEQDATLSADPPVEEGCPVITQAARSSATNVL